MKLIAFKTERVARVVFTVLLISLAYQSFENPLVFGQASTAITRTTGVGDLGTRTTTQGRTIQITGGTRSDNGTGPNLFHSFEQFSVGHGDTAQFLNTTPSISTDNILARVTGTSHSNIFGTIDTTSYPRANLFVMNPAGIVFGPNATLTVSGSVAFTTADYLRLTEATGSQAGIFHAHTSLPNILTSSPVTAFGFLGSDPAAIAVQGSKLIVESGHSISLVGGNHSFTFTHPDTRLPVSVPKGVTVIGGHLKAPDGQIKIASVASPGEILSENLGKVANLNRQSFVTLSTVQISQQSHIETSGERGGRILVRGGHLLVDESTISANTKASKAGPGGHLDPSWLGIGIEVEMAQDAIIDNGSVIETNVESGAAHGSGGVRITADHITVSGGLKTLKIIETNPDADIPFAGIKSNVGTETTAVSSGDIQLNATSIQMTDYGKVETKTESVGNAGQITFNASQNITLGNFADVTSLSEHSSGHSGNIMLRSSQGDLNLSNSTVTSQTIESSGKAGNIRLDAPHGNILLADETFVYNAARGTGTLGGIRITSKDLKLDGGSTIQGDNLAKQPAGDITIRLEGRLILRDNSTIKTQAFGHADSASLIINAPEIVVTNKSSLATSTLSSGNGGQLRLFTDNLHLTNGGTLSSESRISRRTREVPSGRGGEIGIEGYRNPGTSVVIDGPGSGIFTNAEGTGAAGDISVKASSVVLQNGGTLSAATSGTASSANGGPIIVNATDQVTLTNGASITASTSGQGNAGNVLVGANDISISGGSTITASSTGSGNAGTVTVQGLQSPVSSFLIDGSNSGVFTKTTNAGTGGNLSVSSNSIVIQNKGTVSGETSGTGSGGNIALTAGQSVTIKDGAAVSSSSIGPGGAGNIEINAGKQLDVERGSITTQSNQLNGGNINIQAIDLVRVVDGKVSTSVLGGAGSGGNITIDPKVVLLQNSDILAQANRGTGGDISITTPVFIADESSRVDASTPFGLNGRITIQSPTSNLSGTVGQLVSKTSPLQVLLQNRCVALAGGEQSTFLLAGRDALPGEPSGWLSSPISMEHWTGEDTAHASRLMARNQNVDSSPVIAAHSDKSRVLSLRRLTPPGFLVRTFATGATGCPS